MVPIVLLLIFNSSDGSQGLDRRTFYISHTERIKELERELQSARGSNRDEVLRTLSQKHFEQAELHGIIARSAAAIGELYYSLMKENDLDAGAAAGLYRGIGMFELGNLSEAEQVLEEFLRQGNRLTEDLRSAGTAWLGAVRYRQGDMRQAVTLWNNLPDAERTGCSVGAYVHGRVGYNVNGLVDRCLNRDVTGAANVLPVMQAMISTGRYELLPELLQKKSLNDPYIERAGSERELRFFDPSEIVTLSHVHYALAAHYAGQSANPTGERFYTGAYLFETGQYNKVIDTLIGDPDRRSAIYLAGAYYKSGQQDIARDIFNHIERTNDEIVLNNLNLMYAILGLENKKNQAADYFMGKIQTQRPRSRSDVSQEIYKYLGLVYFYNDDYTKALELLGGAFRSERRRDLRANDPGYVILYGSSIVLSRNFISLSEAIDMFSTVMNAYPPATALVEMTSLIDVVTNIGREGRVIYRR
jgi:tetratricopeptide (TPR) repeat protein